MTSEPDNWLNRLSEKIDDALHQLQRHCPKCGGELHRRFSAFDKIGLYLPLPHTIYAKHECERCHTHFRSFRSLTDLFLEAGWVSALFILGEWWAFALAGTITWLILWLFVRDTMSRGEADTVAAGVVMGVVWLLALVFGDLERGRYLTSHPGVMFPLTIFLVLAPTWTVLVLDRYTNFNLKEYK
jgi:hypothetical protein